MSHHICFSCSGRLTFDPRLPLLSLTVTTSPLPWQSTRPACITAQSTWSHTLHKLTLHLWKQCWPPSYFHGLSVWLLSVTLSLSQLHGKTPPPPSPLFFFLPQGWIRKNYHAKEKICLSVSALPLCFGLNFLCWLSGRKRLSNLVRPPLLSLSVFFLFVLSHVIMLSCYKSCHWSDLIISDTHI